MGDPGRDWIGRGEGGGRKEEESPSFFCFVFVFFKNKETPARAVAARSGKVCGCLGGRALMGLGLSSWGAIHKEEEGGDNKHVKVEARAGGLCVCA
jgi:hypothetical protein